jgi:predicted O-methyltransferase YrrM
MLSARLRRLAPPALRDHVQLRALALAVGAIPPRRMHSDEDCELLSEAARGALRAVEIGVYEGASAEVLLEALPRGAELHLIDPFGRHADALPAGWGASEWATRRALERRRARLGEAAPRLHWHPCTSHEAVGRLTGEVDLVFIDGDHSEAGCERDWLDWSARVAAGGAVVFHDAREGLAGGRGLPGPTAVVDRHLRSGATPGWEIAGEADRTVVARRLG